MDIPSATYRIQFHRGFTFSDLENIIDYLDKLGITTIYASPIFKSTPASMHGYDVIDSHTVNPEIGTLDELRRLSLKLKNKGMSWLQDIVPNHMAFNTGNFRLMDVLERREQSAYYNYFDINWNHPSSLLNGKLGVPFLGKELQQCINDHEIKITFSENGFGILYFDTEYPISICAFNIISALTSDEKIRAHLDDYATQSAACSKFETWNSFKKKWITCLTHEDAQKKEIDNILSLINKNSLKLKEIVDNQYYIMTNWQNTEKEINYRRFFTVNELICLRMENDAVFDEYHTLIQTLYEENIISGLRIDHIDGLQDPARYIKKLRERFGASVYIIAEKILEAKESMPDHWELEGTSGYEFLAAINQLMTDKKGAKQLISFYRNLVPELKPYKEIVFDNKKLILTNYMAGEWDNLLLLLTELKLQDAFEVPRLKQAIGKIMISLPVYRIYPEQLPLTGMDLAIMNQTFDKARLDPTYKDELDYLQRLFTQCNAFESQALIFLKRLMQFTGPLTAKGVEDTTFYIYNPLISHDEVGDTPSLLGISVQAFHSKMISRYKSGLLSLNATTTHDTKRGEDSRTRLNILSKIPDDWEKYVRQWFKMNKQFHIEGNGRIIPESNDEYFIYQSIIGGFPENNVIDPAWIERLKAYLTKALREAKINSNWTSPDEVYESGCTRFLENILTGSMEFLKSLDQLIKKVVDISTQHALLQLVIKCTTPGIPDIYQGCELFDLSFVDPDNRRPIDYEKRETYLDLIGEAEKEEKKDLYKFLQINRNEGYEKLFVTWKSLTFRKQHLKLFINGCYLPLQTSGGIKDLIAYARKFETQFALIIINTETESGEFGNEYLSLPENFPSTWRDVYTDQVYDFKNHIYIRDLFNHFPVMLLTSTC